MLSNGPLFFQRTLIWVLIQIFIYFISWVFFTLWIMISIWINKGYHILVFKILLSEIRDFWNDLWWEVVVLFTLTLLIHLFLLKVVLSLFVVRLIHQKYVFIFINWILRMKCVIDFHKCLCWFLSINLFTDLWKFLLVTCEFQVIGIRINIVTFFIHEIIDSDLLSIIHSKLFECFFNDFLWILIVHIFFFS